MAKKNTLPISVDELERQMLPAMAESAKALVAAEPVYGSQNIIRLKSSDFVLNDDRLPKPLRVIILATSFTQSYYEEAYDPNDKASPVCFALAERDVELAPHETSTKKQHDGPCATCPQNRPGTSINPNASAWSRACQGRRRVALLLADDKSEDPQLGSFEFSPAGLRPFSLYVKSVAGVHGAPIYLVCTELHTEASRKGEGAAYAVPKFGGLLTRVRPEWLVPGKGVKVGSEGWLESTLLGRKMREAKEGKMLLAPPTIMAPGEKPMAKRPVTGARRASVKDLKKERKATRGKAA
jgi:hypothetical protein